jgi:uncharacterized membrane protein YozB (DUF420 family)
MLKYSKYLLWIGYGYFSFLLLLITLQYVPYNTDVAFLRIKQDVIYLTYYKVAFFTHVYTSIFLMLLGAFQFLFPVKKSTKKWHRLSGRLYAIIVVLLSGPSGLIMAYHANGGLISQISFVILSLLWIFFTVFAVFYAMKKNIRAHQKFALRSFALTLSAISLRLFKYLIVYFFQPEPIDAYRIVAWLGWTFNLLIVELYILYKFPKLEQ